MFFGALGNFFFVGVQFGALLGWFYVVFGALGNFPLQGVDLGHCVDDFRWFLGR